MPPTTPNEVNEYLISAINNGDVDSAVALYEPDAIFETADGPVTGTAAIRDVMTAFMALKPTLNMTAKDAIRTGDLAVTRGTWSLSGTGADGEPVSMRGRSIEVVRRQTDGNWLFAIDAPNGAED